MSIVKYTTKYTLIGALAVIVCAVIGGFVYSKYQKNNLDKESSSQPGVARVEGSTQTPSGENGNVWDNIEVDVKQPKQNDSDTHIDDDIHPNDKLIRDRKYTYPVTGVRLPSQPLRSPELPPLKLPLDLIKRLDKVDSNGNNYRLNPNYFQEVFEAVSNGQDMETTIKLLKEYGIYTNVVLEHMESYEAFRYVIESAPVDLKGSYPDGGQFGVVGDDIKYAKRVIGEDPRSSEALEAGLYIARVLEDPHERETYYRGVLKYHPNSSKALYGLGDLINYDRPSEGIVYLKKATDLDPFIGGRRGGNHQLGIAYQRLGDYKSAWVHFKKSVALYPYPSNVYSRRQMGAIARGEPILLPIKREVPAGLTFEGASVPDRSSESVPFLESDSHIDVFLFIEVDEEVSPSSPKVPSSPDPSVMDAEHKAFLEFLREQEREAQAAYFKRVNDFIEMAESLEKNAPVDTNDFLEKELERHLLGKQTSVAPDRLIRGFEMMNKYGREEGLKRLEKHDPKLAEQVKRLLNKRQTPPSNTRDRNTRD